MGFSGGTEKRQEFKEIGKNVVFDQGAFNRAFEVGKDMEGRVVVPLHRSGELGGRGGGLRELGRTKTGNGEIRTANMESLGVSGACEEEGGGGQNFH